MRIFVRLSVQKKLFQIFFSKLKFIRNQRITYNRMSTNVINMNSIAVDKLVQYLRIKTVHPQPDYGK